MCQNVYIASNVELPLVAADSLNPGFNTEMVNHEGVIGMLNPILNCKHYYETFSFMGCSCGLSYGDWSRNDVQEEHDKRVQDVRQFVDYLKEHSNNELSLFTSMWMVFPDSYPTTDFVLNDLDLRSFDIEEMVIFKVK